MNTLLKNFGYSFMSVFYDKIIFLIVTIMIINSYGVDSYGIMGFVISAVGLFFLIANIEKYLGKSYVRELANIKSPPFINMYFWNFLYLKAIVTIFFWITMFLVLLIFNIQHTEFIALFSIVFLFDIFSSPIKLLFNAHLKFKQLFYISFVKNSLLLILSIVFIVQKLNFIFFFYTIIIVNAVDMILSLILLFKNYQIEKPSPINIQTVKRWLYNGVFFLIESASFLFNKHAIIILISFFLGDLQLGYFLIAYKIKETLELIFNSLVSVLYPYFSSLSNIKLFSFSKNYQSFSFFLGVLLALIVFRFSENIIQLLFNQSFTITVIILKIFSVELIFSFLNANLRTLINSQNCEKLLSQFMLLTSFIFLILGFLGLSNYGLIGGTYAILISTVIQFVFLSIISYPNYLKKRKELVTTYTDLI